VKKNWRPNPFFCTKICTFAIFMVFKSWRSITQNASSKWPEIQNLSTLDILESTNEKKWRGGLNQPALFSNVHFSMKKGFWRSQISWLFLIHYELLENQKKNCFFIVFWGDLEGAGSPRSQATSRSPALLGLMNWATTN